MSRHRQNEMPTEHSTAQDVIRLIYKSETNGQPPPHDFTIFSLIDWMPELEINYLPLLSIRDEETTENNDWHFADKVYFRMKQCAKALGWKTEYSTEDTIQVLKKMIHSTNLDSHDRWYSYTTQLLPMLLHPSLPNRGLSFLKRLTERIKNAYVDLAQAGDEFTELFGEFVLATRESNYDIKHPIFGASIAEITQEIGQFDTLLDNDKKFKDTLLEVCIAHAALAIEAINILWVKAHERDKELKHPIAPLVKAFIDQPPRIKPDQRKTQIAPDFLKQSRLVENSERLPAGQMHENGEPTQLCLPGFERQSIIVPALPLQVYEAAGGKPVQGGKGAPLDQRIFVSALCAYPLGEREPDGARRLETTLRDITRWSYSSRRFQRQHDLPRIHEALYNIHNMRVSYERRGWNVVQVFAFPEHDTKLDDPLPLLVRMPDGVKGNGAMINVMIMQRYGVESAPKFRAWIRLAYIWDKAKIRSGGARIYATRPKVLRNDEGYITDAKGQVIRTGKLYSTDRGWHCKEGNTPQTAWYHPLAITVGEERNPEADKVPVLDSTDLVHLFFDDKPQTNRNFNRRKHHALKYAYEMHEEGVIVLEPDAICHKTGKRGYRILEPRPKAIVVAN